MDKKRVGNIDRTPEPAIGRSVLQDIAVKAYERADAGVGCDPRRLALGHQLEPCPSKCAASYVEGRTLHYPDNLGRRDAGLSLFYGLARFLLGLHSLPRTLVIIELLTGELILPQKLTSEVQFGSLSTVQPYAPLPRLERIFMGRHGSGTMSRSSG